MASERLNYLPTQITMRTYAQSVTVLVRHFAAWSCTKILDRLQTFGREQRGNHRCDGRVYDIDYRGGGFSRGSTDSRADGKWESENRSINPIKFRNAAACRSRAGNGNGRLTPTKLHFMRERRTSLMRSLDHLRVIPLSIACLCNLQSKLVSIIFLTRFPSFVFLRLLFISVKSPFKRLTSHNVLQVEITFIECRYVYRTLEYLCVNGTMDFYYINIRNLLIIKLFLCLFVQ